MQENLVAIKTLDSRWFVSVDLNVVCLSLNIEECAVKVESDNLFDSIH
jgi:hypothetical protein